MNMACKLYIVATQIGNLEDLSPRALRIFSEVDLILAEDTRVSSKIMSRFGVKTPLQSFHEYSDSSKIPKVISLLKTGKNIALISDAGTPGISDPGAHLVSEIVRELGSGVRIIPIPGPSSVTAALSISGFPADQFAFAGFLPPKKKRNQEVKFWAENPLTIVFFESPYRIRKTLNDLSLIKPDRRAAVVRELSKEFETIYRGTLQKLCASWTIREKGEFVIVLAPTR